MADINSITNITELVEVINDYVKTPKTPPMTGAQMNIILSKMLTYLGLVKTDITITVETTKVINWQTDVVSGDTRTYAQKHGNNVPTIEGARTVTGFLELYKPNATYTISGSNIAVVSITEIFPGKITIK